MPLLVAVILFEAILLVATIWSARNKPVRSRVRIARASDGFPYAL